MDEIASSISDLARFFTENEPTLLRLSGAFSGEPGRALGAAIDAAFDVAASLRRSVARVIRRCRAPRSSGANTASEITALYGLIAGPNGWLTTVANGAQAFSIHEVVEQACDRVWARAESLDVDIEDLPLEAYRMRAIGDPGPLIDVVQTALDNALDAIMARSESDPVAERRIVLALRVDAPCALAIRDTGIGASAETLARISGGERVSDKGEGRGVGLSAARRTMARYPGGAIRLRSDGLRTGAECVIEFEGA